jgi:hypothetical protein
MVREKQIVEGVRTRKDKENIRAEAADWRIPLPVSVGRQDAGTILSTLPRIVIRTVKLLLLPTGVLVERKPEQREHHSQQIIPEGENADVLLTLRDRV